MLVSMFAIAAATMAPLDRFCEQRYRRLLLAPQSAAQRAHASPAIHSART